MLLATRLLEQFRTGAASPNRDSTRQWHAPANRCRRRQINRSLSETRPGISGRHAVKKCCIPFSTVRPIAADLYGELKKPQGEDAISESRPAEILVRTGCFMAVRFPFHRRLIFLLVSILDPQARSRQNSRGHTSTSGRCAYKTRERIHRSVSS
jgi:hypothetical protein